jgi:hypothetical protein
MIAGALLLVQRKNRRLNQSPFSAHGYFELRLAEECQRVGATGSICVVECQSENVKPATHVVTHTICSQNDYGSARNARAIGASASANLMETP